MILFTFFFFNFIYSVVKKKKKKKKKIRLSLNSLILSSQKSTGEQIDMLHNADLNSDGFTDVAELADVLLEVELFEICQRFPPFLYRRVLIRIFLCA